MAAFGGRYPDEYAGAYLAGDQLCVLLTKRFADMALCKSYIDGYALVRDGMRVYAASNRPYTWYQDGKCAILLYCGTDKSIDKKLRAFTGNAPAGGYFAGDDWGKK